MMATTLASMFGPKQLTPTFDAPIECQGKQKIPDVESVLRFFFFFFNRSCNIHALSDSQSEMIRIGKSSCFELLELFVQFDEELAKATRGHITLDNAKTFYCKTGFACSQLRTPPKPHVANETTLQLCLADTDLGNQILSCLRNLS